MAARDTRSNRWIALALGGVILVMVSASFAAVPFYRWFCQVTGYGGTTNVAKAPAPGATDRWVRVSFNSNIANGMVWQFRPKQEFVDVRLGETGLAFFEAYNPTDKPLAGQAAFNVVPFGAGVYFDKIACFCFDLQVLQPGERVDMPVTFYVDPAMLQDVETRDVTEITLSYTMYPADLPDDAEAAQKDASAGTPATRLATVIGGKPALGTQE